MLQIKYNLCKDFHRELLRVIERHVLLRLVLLFEERYPRLVVVADAGGLPAGVVTTRVRLVELESEVLVPAGIKQTHAKRTFTLKFSSFIQKKSIKYHNS